MDLSMFLAQAFGLYLIIGAVAMLMRPQLVGQLTSTMNAHSGLMPLVGFITLLIGIPLVLVHSVWDGELWVSLVSAIAWLTFLKGVALVMAPSMSMSWAERVWGSPSLLKGMLVLMLILGGYLAYIGFGM